MGLTRLKRCLCFARRNPKNCHFREDDCHFTLYSFTNNDWSLRLLEKTWQQLFLSVINLCLGSCIICLVIAREIFLPQSDFSAITEVHNSSFGSFCQSLRQSFQRFRLYYLRNIFTAFAFGLSGQKLNSKNARKIFIIAVDFWVLSTYDKETKNTDEHIINKLKILFIAAQ